MFESYMDISQLPPHVLREVRHFFEIYKELEKTKAPEVEDFRGRIDAHKVIRESMAAYRQFPRQVAQLRVSGLLIFRSEKTRRLEFV